MYTYEANALFQKQQLSKVGLPFLKEITADTNSFPYEKLLTLFSRLYKNPYKFHRPFSIRKITLQDNLETPFSYERSKMHFHLKTSALTTPSLFQQVISLLEKELLQLREEIKFYLLDFGGTITQSGKVGRGFQKKSQLNSLFEDLLSSLTIEDFFDLFKIKSNPFQFKKSLQEKIVYLAMLKNSKDSSNLNDYTLYLFFRKLLLFMEKIENKFKTCHWPQLITFPLILSHGTDTVERTANYLHYLFTLLKKKISLTVHDKKISIFSDGIDFKIIFVTAHTPPYLPESDAYDNLKDAIFLAGELINKPRLPNYINSVLVSGGKIIAFFSKGLTEISFKSDSIFYSPFPQLGFQKLQKLSWGIERRFFQLKTLPKEFEIQLENSTLPLPQTEAKIPLFFTHLAFYHLDFLAEDFLPPLLDQIYLHRHNYRKIILVLSGELSKKRAFILKKFLKNFDSAPYPIFILSPTKKSKKWLEQELQEEKLFLLDKIENPAHYLDKIRFFTSFFSEGKISDLLPILKYPLGEEKFHWEEKKVTTPLSSLKKFPLFYLRASQNMDAMTIQEGREILSKNFPHAPKAIVFEGYGDGHLPLEQIDWEKSIKTYFFKKYGWKIPINTSNIFSHYFYILKHYPPSPRQLKWELQKVIAGSSPKLREIFYNSLSNIRQFMVVKPKMAWATLEKYAIGQILMFMGIESPGKGIYDNITFFEQVKEIYVSKYFFFRERNFDPSLINSFFQNLPVKFLITLSSSQLQNLFQTLYVNYQSPPKKLEIGDIYINFRSGFKFSSLLELHNFFRYIEIVKSFYDVKTIKIGYNVKNKKQSFWKNLDLPYEKNKNLYPDFFSYLRQRKDPFQNKGIIIQGEKEKFSIFT